MFTRCVLGWLTLQASEHGSKPKKMPCDERPELVRSIAKWTPLTDTAMGATGTDMTIINPHSIAGESSEDLNNKEFRDKDFAQGFHEQYPSM